MPKSQNNTDYPRISLLKIAERFVKLNVALNELVATEEELARILGYKGISGASTALLSSLKKFGILFEESSKKGLKFNAKTIELKKPLQGDDGNFEIIEGFAFTPEVFGKIRERFGKSFPEIGELVPFLTEMSFSETSIPRLINSYYESLKFLSSLSEDYQAPYYFSEEEVAEYFTSEPGGSLLQLIDNNEQTKVFDEREKQFYFRIPDYFEATVIIRGQITAESLESLIEFLELSKRSFLKKNV